MYYDSKDNVPALLEADGLDLCDDGESFAAGIIQGLQVKFYDPDRWVLGRDKIQIASEREFYVIKTRKIVQCWLPTQRHPETRVLAVDEKFPDIDAMNEAAPREQWRESFGQMKGPWEKAYIMYLMAPTTKELFTFIGSTKGGFRAVQDLRRSVGLARRIDGSQIVPVVKLSNMHMPTDFGGRQRPHFEILRYEAIGRQEAPPRQLEHVTPGVIDSSDSKVETAAKPKKPKAAPSAKAKAKLGEDDEDPGLDEAGEDEALFDEGAE